MNQNIKPTIAHVVHQLNVGGIEKTLVNILKHFDKNKANFLFICSNSEDPYFYEEEIISYGGGIIKICSPKKNILRHSWQLLKILKNSQIDIIHSHTMLHSGLVMLLSFLARIKLRITHSHNTVSPAFSNKLVSKSSRFLINAFSHERLACSDLAGNFLFGEKTNFTFYPNGIDVENFVFFNQQIKEDLKKELNIKNSDIIIGSVGRLTHQKNFLFLLKIANILIKENKNIKLIIAGEGELREQFKNYIDNNELNDNILLPGNIKNIPELLSLFDVFILPSLNEGLGIAAIEAQAAGINSILSFNVPKEVDLSMGLINFYNLSRDENDWALFVKNILKNKKEIPNDIRLKKINKAGFNIKNLDLLYKIYGFK